MNTNNPMFTKRLAAALLIGWSALAASTVIAADLPKTTHDGLELVKHKGNLAVYRKPGASFGQYDRIALVDCYVAFRKNWLRDANEGEVDLQMRVTAKDMDRIKTELAAEFRKVFTAELEKGGYSLVDVTGKDVLILRPAIINLDVAAPDTMKATGMNRTIVNSAGQMTLYLELFDSMTNSIIARVIDTEADRIGGVANRVTNKGAADVILRDWAHKLAQKLEAAKGAGAEKS